MFTLHPKKACYLEQRSSAFGYCFRIGRNAPGGTPYVFTPFISRELHSH